MKKLILVLLALILAMPAVTYAGSATSRWDLTIGGWVKFDAGYGSKAAATGIDTYAAPADGAAGRNLATDETGAFQMFGGDSALNFSVKGPDAWGAKTSAFIEGDFRGQTTNGGQAGTRNGTFSLRHAFMKFNWAATELLIGHTWQMWGLQPSFNLLGSWDLLGFNKGGRQAQVRVTQNFNKNWQGTFGVFSPVNALDQLGFSTPYNVIYNPNNAAGQLVNGAGVASNGVALYPHLQGEIVYKTDACGKIGPWSMQFGLGGFYGNEQELYQDPNVATPYFKTDSVRSWGAAFKGFIPIIPEKKGSKAGAFSLSGTIFTGRNMQVYEPGRNGPLTITPFDTDASVAGVSYNASQVMGGWGQLSYYFTNEVWINGLYGYRRNILGERARQAFAGIADTNNHFIFNIMYDVNPAIRMGVEYTYLLTDYNGYPNANTDTKGAMHIGRVAAWYFF